MRLWRTELERAMRRASRNPEHQDDVYAGLLGATLYAPKDARVRLDDGREVRGLFTRLEDARAAAPGAEIVEGPGPELLAAAMGELPVVLNPGDELWYELHADELEALSVGLMPGEPSLVPYATPSGHRLAIGPLDENPVELKLALSAVLRERPEVERAYLATTARRHGERALFLGLVVEPPGDDEALEAVVRALDPVLAGALPPGESIDVAPIEEERLRAACDAAGPPFYRR